MTLTYDAYVRRVRWQRMADTLARAAALGAEPSAVEATFAARFGRPAAEAAFDRQLPSCGRELINWGY